MFYVSESVYQHTASINFHGLLVRKHSTLHDQANQAHKLPTLTLYVHWHYITKRENPYHLYYKFQIKTSLASDRTHCHCALTVSPRGEGPISSSSSIANDQNENEDEDQNEDGKTKTKAKNKEQNNHHHRNFNLSFKLMAMINNKINRTLTRMYTVEHWA